jgi:hypothetical protein
MIPAAVGLGLVGAGVGLNLLRDYFNYQQQRDLYGLNQRNLKWQKEAQRITWEREDNATQRRVADLRAAGLSPTLAAGGAAQSSQPIKPTTPTVAPQINFDAMEHIQAMSNMAQTRAQVKYMNKQEKVAEAQAELLLTQAADLRGETITSKERIKLMSNQAYAQATAAQKNQIEAIVKQWELDFQKKYGKSGGWLGSGVSIPNASHAIDMFVSQLKGYSNVVKDKAKKILKDIQKNKKR